MPPDSHDVGHAPKTFADVPAFVRHLRFDDLPAAVVAQAQRCVLDLIGVAAAGSSTPGAMIVNAYAYDQMAGRNREARILFDGRRTGLAGAAFAGATTIDAFDAHDGHVLTKGHAGAALAAGAVRVLRRRHRRAAAGRRSRVPDRHRARL